MKAHTDMVVLEPFRRALQPFHVRIALVIGVLVIALGVGIAILLANAAETRILQVESDHLESTAEHMARELAEGMDRFSREAVTQSLNDRFQQVDVPVARMREALDAFQRLHPEFAYVSIVDVATAQVLAATGGVFEGGSARGRPTFENALERPFLGDVHDAVRLAELLPKPADGEALRFLDVAAPIKDGAGRTFRVLAAHVAWAWTRSLREGLFRPMQDRRNVELVLVDTANKVVLAISPHEPVGTDLSGIVAPQLGKPAAAMVWPDGRSYLSSAVAVRPQGAFPGFGWKVVARQSLAVALQPASDLRNAFMIGSLMLSLAAALIGWYLAVHLSKPVRQLAEVAERAEAGAGVTALHTVDDDDTHEMRTVRRAISRLADTARAEADASTTNQRQFAVLAENLPQVVWVADAHGWLEYVNRSSIQSPDARDQFNVEDFSEFVLDVDRPVFTKAWRAALSQGAALHHRCRVELPQPSPLKPVGSRWFDFDAAPVVDAQKKIVRWVGTMCDVHDLVTLAEVTEQALQSERAARTASERLARLQDEFLAVVSHELRSPLNAITGWGELLSKRAGDDPMIAKAGAVILRNGAVQAALINDLMDMSAVMVGKLQVERVPLDLAELAHDVVLSHLHAAQQKGIDLVMRDKTAVLVEADPRRMSQVLSNLVGNALKFTDSGGKIEVTVWHEGGYAWARVTDTGRGIAPEFLPHVFDRLRQEDSSRTRHAGGLGLGLTIAQALVRLHGGAISAESPGPGCGASFTFSLQLALLNASDSLPIDIDTSEAGPDLTGLRILLVDDEDDAREVAHVAFASLGAQVAMAGTADQALTLIDEHRFDVLVTDIGMPGMDGFGLLHEVRRRYSSKDLPVVALTAFAMESHVHAGRQAGFNAYVTKPISLRRLAEGVLLARTTSQA